MKRPARGTSRDALLGAAINLFRTQGFEATRVEQICAAAAVSKGAFFHHFASKEALQEASLAAWDEMGAAMDAHAPWQALTDPMARLLGCMDHFIGVVSDPGQMASCLAGNAAQECGATSTALRDGAQACFASAELRFTALLKAAASDRGVSLPSASLARLWMAAIQGSLVLAKASGDRGVIPSSLEHVRSYVRSLLRVPRG